MTHRDRIEGELAGSSDASGDLRALARHAEAGTLLAVLVVDDGGFGRQVSLTLEPDGDRELVDAVLRKPCAKKGDLHRDISRYCLCVVTQSIPSNVNDEISLR